MSGYMLINVDCFCGPCFERLVEKGSVERNDYNQKTATTLYDIVTNEIIEATTERKLFCDPFFRPFGELGWSWQAGNKKVIADDIAIVVSRALIQDGCKTRYLRLNGIHYNDPGFGTLGYKALAYALSINKTVTGIEFFDDCDGDEEFCECAAGYQGMKSFSYAADKSKGLFLKAFQHNKESALECLEMCSSAFGPHTWASWMEAKPGLECGPLLHFEKYHDIEDYISFDEEDESDY